MIKSISPINGEVIWEGASSTKEEIDAAIQAASKAFKTWRRLSFEERKAYLEKFVEVVESKKDFLAELLCKENGKTITEAYMELSSIPNKFKISLEAYADRCKNLERDLGRAKSITLHKPHGVIAVYGPYNFPVHVPNGHIMPALLAGNVLIIKPSELTPAISEEIFKCWQEAGLPEGVMSLIQGKAETGIELSKHDGLDGIFFTGSSKVGKILHQNYAGKLGKILALELGGNNPLVVWDNKDHEKAAELIIQSAFITNGQRCTCARRLILKDSPESDELLEVLVNKVKELKLGNPLEEANFMGPVISKEQADKLLAAQASLLEKGAKTILKMERQSLGDAYVSLGIIDCTAANDLVDEEYFGPLLQVYKVKDWDSAIKLANSTEYGLSSGLISDSRELFEEFTIEIEAGLANWNTQITGATATAPFGGIKMSGNHSPSAYYAADYCVYPVATMTAEN